MHFSLLLTVVVAASPELAAKSEDHLGAIEASLSRTEALVESARAKRVEGVECAARRLEELRAVRGAAEKAVAVIRSGSAPAAVEAQYGRVVTSRSKAERLGAEAVSCFPKEAVARLGLNGRGPVASKSAKGAPKVAKKGAGGKSSPGEKLPSEGNGDSRKDAGGKTAAKDASPEETASADPAAEGARDGFDDILKTGRDAVTDPRQASQMMASAQPAAAPAPAIAKGAASLPDAHSSPTGARSLATAANAAAQPASPPPHPGNSREATVQGLVLQASAAEGLRGSELARKATDHLSRIKNAMSQVLRKVEGARNEKDVVKLNCVSEKLQQIRQVLLSAEGAETDLHQSLARDDGMADAKYSRIALARGKAEQMGSEAEECASQLALVVDTATEVAVEQPEQLPSIGMGNETAFGPLIASDAELAESREATRTTIWASGGGVTTTLGATSSGGGSAPPPPPPPLLRPPAASPYY